MRWQTRCATDPTLSLERDPQTRKALVWKIYRICQASPCVQCLKVLASCSQSMSWRLLKPCYVPVTRASSATASITSAVPGAVAFRPSQGAALLPSLPSHAMDIAMPRGIAGSRANRRQTW